jgi:hypothetical protein
MQARAAHLYSQGQRRVEVLGMAPEDECESEMFVWVRRGGQTSTRYAWAA